MATRKPLRERPKVITLTDAAADRVKEIVEDSETGVLGVRIGVKNAGCAGMAYTLDYVTEPEPLDELVEDKGVTVLIDTKALMYLIGSEMDYVEDKLQSGFVFNNPNEKGRCGCGESFHI